jgi:hypothetical protein
MANLTNDNYAKKRTNYKCETCDFNSYKQSDYQRHILTAKHIRLTNANNLLTPNTPNTPNTGRLHSCSGCDKNFKHASSLCKHKKTCTYLNENTVITISNDHPTTSIVEKKEDMPDMKELIIALMTQNQDMQKQMFEQQQQILKLIPQSENTTNNV